MPLFNVRREYSPHFDTIEADSPAQAAEHFFNSASNEDWGAEMVWIESRPDIQDFINHLKAHGFLFNQNPANEDLFEIQNHPSTFADVAERFPFMELIFDGPEDAYYESQWQPFNFETVPHDVERD